MIYPNTDSFPANFQAYGRNIYELVQLIMKSDDKAAVSLYLDQIVVLLKRRKDLQEMPSHVLIDLFREVGKGDAVAPSFEGSPKSPDYATGAPEFRCCGAHLVLFIRKIYPTLLQEEGHKTLLLPMLSLLQIHHKKLTPSELHYHLQKIGGTSLPPLAPETAALLPSLEPNFRGPVRKSRGYSRKFSKNN